LVQIVFAVGYVAMHWLEHSRLICVN